MISRPNIQKDIMHNFSYEIFVENINIFFCRIDYNISESGSSPSSKMSPVMVPTGR